ncbi:transporter substrate-binding domain-containing protein [Sphaerisporangium sp. TRM90804]|uniref:transporter substrate-binding domain-containing protein n=1 Tax=Sphaerisporangium sp. TRM90804 TaxID=3031113 RepID=UPI002448D357|nr:transporter substrate-binding domain-containing protein [Sphaerisporangium sp. TRM90804]MDH2425147.1 transporter substrate-binding domain-containing protein [Sphaerisporangium sp. TRM90804]
MSSTPPVAPPPFARPAGRVRARLAAAALALAAATAAPGCGQAPALAVGVRPDRPGLAERTPGGGYRGFEIAIAGYVARRLGYRDDQVRYVDLGRPAASGQGRPDLVMGTPSAGRGTLAGSATVSRPYLVSGQDILAASGDLSIRAVGDLTQKRVCSSSPGPLVARFGTAWQRVFMISSNAEDCVRMLAARRVQAVTDDAAVLAGLAAAWPGRFRLVGSPFTRDSHAIGLGRGGDDLRGRVDDALRAMFEDGTWRGAMIDHLGSLAANHPSPPDSAYHTTPPSPR